MARTDIPKTKALGPYPVTPLAANAADLAMLAADVANKNSFVIAGKELVFAHNTGVGVETVTLNSAVDAQNRLADIEIYDIQPGEIAVFGPFRLAGWKQADKKMHLEASSADVEFGVVELP